MPVTHADISSHGSGPLDPIERLRRAELGAFFRPNQLADAGLSPDRLRALVGSGAVQRVGRSLYRMADAEPTADYSLAMACARVPNSIVCLLSALRVHGIGTQSPAGSRFVERMLTVTATLRQQKRHVLEYLTRACAAHRLGKPSPSLLPDAAPKWCDSQVDPVNGYERSSSASQ